MASVDMSVIVGEKMENFFEKRLNSLHLSSSIAVKSVSSSVGKGMFATKAMSENEIIYNEMHMFGRKLQDQAFTTCNCCLKVIGDLPTIWSHCESSRSQGCGCDCTDEACSNQCDDNHHEDGHCSGSGEAHCHGEDHGEPEPQDPVDCPDFEAIAKEINFPVEDVVVCESFPCRNLCGVVYCSELCADDNWIAYHQLLCPANSPQMQEFIDFTNDTNEVFYMVAQVIAVVIIQSEKAGSNEIALANAMIPLRMLSSKHWVEVVQIPSGMNDQEADDFKSVLTFLIGECQEFLRAALLEYASLDLYAPLFTTDVVSKLMGMFETNNIRISSRSALSQFCDKLEDFGAISHLLSEDQLERLAKYQDMSAEGVGLYSLHSCINHSCVPNCVLLKLEGGSDSKIAVIAQRDIAEGDEITISYIDENAPVEERQSMLADYGFVCACAKCKEQCSTMTAA